MQCTTALYYGEAVVQCGIGCWVTGERGVGMIGEGATLFHNPWGTPLFGASFFSITGLHLTHVVGGVIALFAVAAKYRSGRYKSDDLDVMGLYWHFVDAVWVVVFTVVYVVGR